MNNIVCKIKYLVFKIVLRILQYLNIVTFKPPGICSLYNADKVNKAVFLLDDSLFVHLGDQLFWAPTIIALHKAGYSMGVFLPGDLKPFWEVNGIKSESAEPFDDPENIFFVPLPKLLEKNLLRKNTVAVELTDTRISKRISVYLCEEVCRLLNVECSEVPSLQLPKKMDGELRKQIADLGDCVWLLNDIVLSGFFRITADKRKRIWAKAEEIAQNGGKIVYVQGKDERHYPYYLEDVVTLDLRDQTTPSDIMAILQLPNVQGTISFDNFLMHASLLCNKKAFVVFKGSFSEKQKMHHFNKVDLAFKEVNAENISYL